MLCNRNWTRPEGREEGAELADYRRLTGQYYLSRDGEPRAGADTNECLEDIEKRGFHITDAHVRITESVICSIVLDLREQDVIIERGTLNNPSLANSN
jgi:hypothetical protein